MLARSRELLSQNLIFFNLKFETLEGRKARPKNFSEGPPRVGSYDAVVMATQSRHSFYY